MAEVTSHLRPSGHDIIVIGASAGGLQALQRLLADLPANLPVAAFVVLHMGASSHLAEVLGRSGMLPVSSARSGQSIERGRVYVAVPGVHLLLHGEHVLLRRGPRENLARPAIDPLFRSAACTFGARVIGVVLSGALNDGTAGLRAIKQCGGLAVVQDPADAAVPDMPLSAQRHVDIDYVVPIGALGDLLARLAYEPAGETPEIPDRIKLETAIATQELAGMAANDQLGSPSRFTCPECHGTLWEINDGRLLRYRCHVGHALTGQVMLAAQAKETEEMLWSLMRAHQERAELARRMADQERSLNRSKLADQMTQRAKEYDEDAEVLRGLLSRGDAMTAADDREPEVA